MNRINERVLEEANYMVSSKKTIREIAKIFRVSKSTVHKDLKERLKNIDKNLYHDVTAILKYHSSIRHIKGGESTRLKYLNK